jgi:hypothetical protein
MIKLWVLTFVFFHPTGDGDVVTKTLVKKHATEAACEAERKEATAWIKQQKDAPQGAAFCAPVVMRAT